MDQLLTPRQLAAYLGISEQTVYNRLSQGGDLPPIVRIGRLPRFSDIDTRMWLATKVQPVLKPEIAPEKLVRHRGRPTKAEQIAYRKSSIAS